jgi:diacylglycerol kinase (ATP)
MNKLFDLRKMALSFIFAFRGIYKTAANEQNFRFQVLFIVPVILIGMYLPLNPPKWGLVIISIFFVLASEMFNTAIEKLCDKYAGAGKIDKDIGLIKDISAGAVLLSAAGASVIGIIFLLIPLIRKLTALL